jgi:hypothetical protein
MSILTLAGSRAHEPVKVSDWIDSRARDLDSAVDVRGTRRVFLESLRANANLVRLRPPIEDARDGYLVVHPDLARVVRIRERRTHQPMLRRKCWKASSEPVP